jgi:hypothetical protein
MDTYYYLYTVDAYGTSVPLADSETGSPSVFLERQNAQTECDQLNRDTDGGYFVGEGEFEDVDSAAGPPAMIRKGQQVWIRPEYQDPGDEDYVWTALEDEDGGRVRIQPQIPGMAILPNQVVGTDMLETREQP